MQITLTFTNSLNFSLAIGDTIHYSTTGPSGGYQTSQGWFRLGEVVDIHTSITGLSLVVRIIFHLQNLIK